MRHGTADAAWDGSSPGWMGAVRCSLRNRLDPGRAEEGSAAVEFVFLSLLLMVPVVYFVITVAQIQAASFAATGASDQAARVLVTAADERSGTVAVEEAVSLALADQAVSRDSASVSVHCEPADCHAVGTAVTVRVEVMVPLPFVPPGWGLDAARVAASGTQFVGRFR